MTREEAINRFQRMKKILAIPNSEAERTAEAIDMAIEALQTDIVHCKDCVQKHIGGSVTQYCWCDFWDREVDCNNGCSWGERKGGDTE